MTAPNSLGNREVLILHWGPPRTEEAVEHNHRSTYRKEEKSEGQVLKERRVPLNVEQC